MSKTENRGRTKSLKPLKGFDFALVGDRLQGLLINVDRDLERKTSQAFRAGDQNAERGLSLLNAMMCFAKTSYQAVLYLAGDLPEDSRRKPIYAMVVPTINRQLLDLLFSLVYMLDDFDSRSFQYQRAAFREMTEEQHQFKTRFGSDPEWQDHFSNVDQTIEQLIERFKIAPEEQKNPKLVPYWKHPFHLKEERTKSRDYLRYLDKWLYGDTSAQAHLSFAGLLRVWPFLVADKVGGEAQQIVENRTIHQYRFQHISRTAFLTLAIATELDTFCKLGNEKAIDYIWVILSEYVPEAKEMFEIRYQNRART